MSIYTNIKTDPTSVNFVKWNFQAHCIAEILKYWLCSVYFKTEQEFGLQMYRKSSLAARTGQSITVTFQNNVQLLWDKINKNCENRQIAVSQTRSAILTINNFAVEHI